MLATNRHPSSTFLILKIIFSKKRKGGKQSSTESNRQREGERGKRQKEGVKRQGRRQKSYHSPTVSALVLNVQKLKSKSAHKALHDFFKRASPRCSALQLAMVQPTTNVSVFPQSICNFTLALITSCPRKVCLLFCDVPSSAQKRAFR